MHSSRLRYKNQNELAEALKPRGVSNRKLLALESNASANEHAALQEPINDKEDEENIAGMLKKKRKKEEVKVKHKELSSNKELIDSTMAEFIKKMEKLYGKNIK